MRYDTFKQEIQKCLLSLETSNEQLSILTYLNSYNVLKYYIDPNFIFYNTKFPEVCEYLILHYDNDINLECEKETWRLEILIGSQNINSLFV
jgi:hypothetical protein